MRRTVPRLITASLFFTLLSVPALALAQPGPASQRGYEPYLDDEGFFVRRGLTAGVGLGVGALSTDSGIFDCVDCAFSPAAVSIHGHLGGMLDHRTALMGEYWGQMQRLDYFGDAYGVQHMLMGAIQHWLHPQLWIKGGLGLASLQVSYYDGFVDELNHGTAIMAAAGYEIAFAPDFSLDIQLRVGSGMYRYVQDRATTAVIAGGLSWF